MIDTTSSTALPANRSKPRGRVLVWLKRGFVGLGILIVSLGAIGATYQAIATEIDRRNFPPPGQLVDVGGYRLHLYCTGESQPGTPTVILESMANGEAVNWAWVQPEVAKATRVCSYDRAGSGWSDLSPKPFRPQEAAADLHALLSRVGVNGPYILVGHSLGGVIVRQFAADHPSDVVGIVLLDSAHPDQYERHPEYLNKIEDMMPVFQVAPLMARLGLMRLYVAGGGFDFGELPVRQKAELMAAWSTSKHWDSQLAGIRAVRSFYAEAHSLGNLGDLPLVVISAGDNPTVGWDELQVELAALSSNSVHRIVEGATHESLAFNPQDAGAASQAILDVMRVAQTGKALE